MKRILLAATLFFALAGFSWPAPVQAQSAPAASNLAAIRKAAEQGDAASQHKLGVAYVNGQGVPQDKAQGLSWLRKALAQGHAETQL
jgi:TPR repeat protein